MKVGFIGLGNMGQPMARNLLRAGYELAVYNRTRSRTEKLRIEGAYVADSPLDVALHAEVLITMLPDDHAVEEVIFGGSDVVGGEVRGALHVLGRGATHVSMSTISVRLSQRLAEMHSQAGQAYVAAPVFGRPQVATAAKLWIVAAGPPNQIERCRPLFDTMGQGVFVVGEEVGAANVVKLAGNFMIASMIETLGEAFALVRKSGVEAKQFLEIINGVVFKSLIYENYGIRITEERYEPAEFKLRLGLKDMRLVLEAAESVSAPMPLVSLIRDHFVSAIARGQGEIDWLGLARVSAENAGLGEGVPVQKRKKKERCQE
jgi:3-hydroxyisobutyrate dehydrogenase-like beta-hydroxyacid dehydrogenase